MNSLCSHCLATLPFGWSELPECAECRALEVASATLAQQSRPMLTRQAYFDWPQASWRQLVSRSQSAS